jgi:hypothetical protein
MEVEVHRIGGSGRIPCLVIHVTARNFENFEYRNFDI